MPRTPPNLRPRNLQRLPEWDSKLRIMPRNGVRKLRENIIKQKYISCEGEYKKHNQPSHCMGTLPLKCEHSHIFVSQSNARVLHSKALEAGTRRSTFRTAMRICLFAGFACPPSRYLPNQCYHFINVQMAAQATDQLKPSKFTERCLYSTPPLTSYNDVCWPLW